MLGCWDIALPSAKEIDSQLSVQHHTVGTIALESKAQHPLLNVCPKGFIEYEAVGFPVICHLLAQFMGFLPCFMYLGDVLGT